MDIDAFYTEALTREGTDPFYHDAARVVEALRALEATIDGLRAECRRIECLHHAVSQDAARLREALKGA